jgi:CubicO group peptidase (beta-lactamase class C family)
MIGLFPRGSHDQPNEKMTEAQGLPSGPLIRRPPDRFLGLAVLALGLCSCFAEDDTAAARSRNHLSGPGMQQGIADRFVSISENAISNGVVEGIQFVLVEDGEILDARAFGLADRALNLPMTADTPINVASISKPLTAWGMLALVQRSKLNLETNVGELANGSELYRELFADSDVTIRMLLSHTSGLSGPSVPVTPATDMARFIIMYTDRGRPIRRQIVSDEGIRDATEPRCRCEGCGGPGREYSICPGTLHL